MISDPLILENEYYSKKLYLSYSALNLMLHSPKLYYDKYILGQKEELMSPSLTEGKIIHCLLLDNKSFDKQFIVSPDKLPTDSTRVVIDRVFEWSKANSSELNLESLDWKILDELKLINLHQSLKTDEQRLAKMLVEANTGYYSYLLSKGNKTVIDQQTLDKCKEYESVIRDDHKVCRMLGFNIFDSEVPLISNEKLLQCELEDYPFGLKGIPDSVVISTKNKTVSINDLKTTSKTIADFKESIEFYRYDLQAAIQWILVWENYPLYHDYEWTFRFIVIDKYKQLYPFEVSPETFIKWKENLSEVLREAEYHYKSKRWGLPMKYDQGEVFL